MNVKLNPIVSRSRVLFNTKCIVTYRIHLKRLIRYIEQIEIIIRVRG